MSTVKKTISINIEVANETSSLNSNFSATVETALIEYLQNYRTKKAIQSFGKWEKREESGAAFVKNLRMSDDRGCISRNSLKKKKKK